MNLNQRNLCYLVLFLCWVVGCTAEHSVFKFRSIFGRINEKQSVDLHDNPVFFQVPRGGSTAAATEEDEEDDDDEDTDEEKDEEEKDTKVAVSSQPVTLLVQTNWGNAVLDQRVELMAARSRNIASIKKSLSRLLPGRPPILGLELVFEGRILDDEMLVDELFDEEDDEDEDEGVEDGSDKVLILNSIPPVDPKFATELAPQLKAHVEDDVETLSTEDLINAFVLNQAAMSRNSQFLANPSMESSPLLRLEIQEQAKLLREQLRAEIPDNVWESSLQPIRKSHNMEEYRGQRYRSGKGGARTNLKKSIQHNLNIQWGVTIRNFLLFLFFGYFGGRNSVSRYLMLLGAPLCFVLQARPVKMWSKILFYLLADPPGIVLSLLPAPQQAILSMDVDKAYAALYGSGEDSTTLTTKEDDQEDEDDYEESEEDYESDIDTYDSEEE